MKFIKFKNMGLFRDWLGMVDLQSIAMVQRPDGIIEVEYKEKS